MKTKLKPKPRATEEKKENTNNKIKKRCHWCQRFVGETGQATVKEPKVFYCSYCYKKGLEMEYEAMGLYSYPNF